MQPEKPAHKFKLHEVVKLLTDLPGRRVCPGNVGAIVDVFPVSDYPYGYMVEFINYCGYTYRIITVDETEIALATDDDMLWDAQSRAKNMDVDYDTFDPDIN